MPQENLRVIGAREHNLKNITVETRAINLLCLRSLGSGKSSLAFDTILPKVSADMWSRFLPMPANSSGR
jgi:excinuclease UvrABC ATPase subunit